MEESASRSEAKILHVRVDGGPSFGKDQIETSTSRSDGLGRSMRGFRSEHRDARAPGVAALRSARA